MASALEITFPGNLAQLATAAMLRLVPSSTIEGGDIYLVTDLGGIFSFAPASLLADDGATVIKPADRTALQAGRWLFKLTGQAITYQLPATGSISTSVTAAAARVPSVQDFGATPDNPDCSAAFLAARTWLETQRLATGGRTPRIDVPTGLYRYATSPNFGVNNAQMNCAPGTVFQHTGSGPAFLIDGGRADSIDGDMYRFQLNGQPTIMGNANSTYGLDMRGLIHCNISADVANVPVAAARLQFGVCSTFQIRNTGLGRGGQSIVPVDGFILDKRGQFEAVTACTLDTCILEQASNIGLRMLAANGCEVLGGTCESNGVGNIYIGANCADIKIDGVDCEFSGQYDVACYGTNITINLVVSDKLILIAGNNNKIGLGSYNAIVNSGNDNSYKFIRRGIAGGTFTDTGLRTRRESVFNVATQSMDQDQVVWPYAAWMRDTNGDRRRFHGAGVTIEMSSNGQWQLLNGADQETAFLGSLDGSQGNSALRIAGTKVVGPRGAAIPNPTDAASTQARLIDALNFLRGWGAIAP